MSCQQQAWVESHASNIIFLGINTSVLVLMYVGLYLETL